MSADELYIRRCFEIALLGAGNVSPNPLVGSVIVYNDKIIGEGWHQKYGGPHAEVNAVNSVKTSDLGLLKDSTIYVSLEPCSHYGITPPCAELVLKHQFSRVVMSCIDPNPKVSGRSVKMFKDAGIQVTTGVLEKEGQWLIRMFSHAMFSSRPYIVLKFAQTKDGFMGQQGKQVWINNPLSKRLSHQWRNELDAIMIGTNTASTDNPTLNNRLWFGKSPVRVALDRKAKLSVKANIFSEDVRTIVYAEPAYLTGNKHHNDHYKPLTFGENMIPVLLEDLFKNEQIKSLLIEGGAQLLNSFINQNLWDEARISTSNHFLETGIKAPNVTGELVSKDQLGSDEWVIIRNKNA
ncbi:MAG: bifunctional diaminohydroxyphosphoribosylaminopyrimidine deaminase/5-amino-6-(5-phosphoribosylamino)uracil reductase RibD [Bacteroidota bacterium]